MTSVGADAGFAAIVGLAILVLLYFAQARETSTLRDESVAASQRVAELEKRLTQMDGPRVVARPEGAQQPVPAPAMAIAAAPAGVGAPALLSATRLVPLGARAPAPPPQQPAPAPVRPPDAAPLLAQRPAVAPRPATAAAAAAGASPVPVAAEASAPSAASNGTGEHAATPPSPKPAARSQPRPRARPAAASRSLSSPPARAGGRGRLGRVVPAVLIGLLAAAAIVALVIVTSAGGNSRTSAGSKTTNAPAARTAAGFNPRSVTVAVLNGTNVFQLAHRVALKLQRAGYRGGTVATATDQTHTSTLVGYLPGQRSAAVHVANALKLPAASVAQVDQSAQGVACPPPSACGAEVIVTVGTDLSNTP